MSQVLVLKDVRLLILSFFVLIAASDAQGQVMMNVSTQPSAGVSGVSTVNAIGSRFPASHGTLSAAGLIVSLSTSCGGPVVASASAKSITTVLGAQSRVGFVVPSSLIAGTYFVTLAGTASDGSLYSSTNGSCSELRVTHANTAQVGCVASGTLSVNAPPQGGTVTAYAANGCWACSGNQYKGIEAVNIEGPVVSIAIPTPDVVNSCATNSATGQTICAANGKDLYLIQGSTLMTTLQSGSSGGSTFSGVNNFGVAVNPMLNQAVIGVGLDFNKTGVHTGLQVLDLATHSLTAPTPAKNKVSDEILIDPARGFVLSPNDSGNFELFAAKADGTLTEYSHQLASYEDWDSAAEDCTTGIALAPSASASGDIYIGDLTQAQFDQDKRVWTTPEQIYHLGLGMETIAIAPGDSHLGILSHEFTNGGEFAVVRLPATSGSGTPAILDYVRASIPGFLGTPDPHSITAYTSPNDGKPYGVLASSFPATNLARIDLTCILAQPRKADQHTVSVYADSCIKIFATCNAPPAAPVITATPRATANASLVYEDKIQVSAATRFPLSFSLLAGPVGLSIDPVTGILHWVPSPAQVGSQSFTVRVTDVFGLTATSAFSINVFASNRTPPVITSNPVTRSIAGAPYRYGVTATDKDPDSLRFSLSSAPTGMTIDQTTGLLQWTPPSGLANQVAKVTLQVIDANFAYVSQSFQISLVPAVNHPPVIVSNPGNTATVGQTYSYQVRGADPDNDPLAYSLVSAPIGTSLDPATGVLRWTPASNDVGDLKIGVRAQDPDALVATQTFSLHVQRAYPVPIIAVNSPTPGSQLSKPVNIVATISDPSVSGSPIVWTVDLVRGDNTTQRIGAGSGAISGAAIAHLDPTRIRDDSYSVVINVGKDGQEDSKIFTFDVSSKNLKMGNFTTSFTDISIPVAGIPLTITRVYNSLDTSSGDFGAGWRLGLPGQVVDSARETPLEPFTSNTRVYVTLPDGTREGFTFSPNQPSPLIPIFVPGFTPDAGVTDKLSVQPADLANANGTYFEFLGGPYNPSTYKLTTKYGVEFTIDEAAGLQRVKDLNGNILTLNSSGIQSSSGIALPIERDDSGRIKSITEPGGNHVSYSYDAKGNLASSVDQSGNETRYSYDSSDFPHYLTAITDPLGRPVTRNVYSDSGRLTAQCDANGNPTTLIGCITLSPDIEANTQTIINGRGFRTDLLYSQTGNVLRERHWANAQSFADTSYKYDANGNLTEISSPAGDSTRYAYDNNSNLLSMSVSGFFQFQRTYNPCNLAATSMNALGDETKFEYDSRCNLISQTGATGGVVRYSYNSRGLLTDLYDQVQNHWQWRYDDFGYLQGSTDPSGSTTSAGFSKNGDLIWRVDRNGRRVDLRYNSIHLPVAETWVSRAEDNLNFEYDSAGHITSVAKAFSKLTFTYDSSGRVSTIDNRDTKDVPALVLYYSYDDNGNTVSVKDSLGSTTYYTYDFLDRLETAGQSGGGTAPERVNFTYGPSGSLIGLERYAKLDAPTPVLSSTYKYECQGCDSRVSDITHSRSADGSVLQVYHLDRDVSGNITHIKDFEGDHLYTYDSDAHLTAAAHSDHLLQPTESYRYDLAGNRLSSHLRGTYIYGYQQSVGGNQLLSDSDYSYSHDKEGNVTSRINLHDGSFDEYLFDSRNRLITVNNRPGKDLPISRALSMKYDVGGRLLSRSDGLVTTAWQYDGANPILAFANGDRLVSRSLYTRSADQLLGQSTDDQVRWALTDQVGTVRATVDNLGGLVSRHVYDSFGNVRLFQGEGFVDGYQGRNSIANDLVDFRRRTYEPSTGRFVQQDYLEPFGYVFASGNPIGRIDPFGGQDTAEYKETQEETATNIPCEKHHFLPKYVIGYDNGVAWNVTRASHRAFHKWFSLILPFGGAPLPEDQAADLLNWAYNNFQLEPCPNSFLYDVIPYRGPFF